MKTLAEARLETRSGKPMMLERVALTGDVRGMLFEASVVQHFRNPGAEHVEVVYTFPLPWNAVLLDISVQLGDQQLTGSVVARVVAEEGYEAALAEGDAAILLQKNRDRSYSLNLGNLAGNERCVITLRYAQVLQFSQGSLRLLVPTVIAPRYGDAVADGGLQPHQAPVSDFCAAYSFDITVTLHGALSCARVASPSHAIAVARPASVAPDVLVISLQQAGALDRDFVVVVDELADQAVGCAAPDSVVPGAVAVLAGFCPDLHTEVDAAPRAVSVKILVDCSSSMNGDNIGAARRSLHAVVEQLGADDRFSLSRFGNTVVHRSRGLWRTTGATKLAARRWVDALEADLGGTQMAAALTSTFALSGDAASDLLLVTDGEISAIDQTIAAATASGSRVFIVAIGSSPAESHLRRLAEATGGACDFVAPGEAVAPAVLRMFARLRSPRLHDLRLVWPMDSTPRWVSPVPSAVFHGDTVNISALVCGTGAGTVQLVGARAPGGSPEVVGSVRLAADVTAGDTLARVVASARTGTVPGLAVDYQLVTDETSFLLVHVRAEADKAISMPALHRVAQMVPAGWAGIGDVRHSYGISNATLVSENISHAYDSMYRAPAVFRRASRAAPPDEGVFYDIPAFLRKETPREGARSDPLRWCPRGADAGLTPLGASEWLRETPHAQWPSTPDTLKTAGFPVWVVEWLELGGGLIGQPGADRAASAIEVFLLLLSLPHVHDALIGGSDLRGLAGEILESLSGATTTVAGGGSRVLLDQSIVTALGDMRADRWPDAIYSMAA